MDKLKKQYDQIEIPGELEFLVKKTIEEQERKMNRKNANIKKALVAVAATAAVFVGSINVIPGMSLAFADVPIIGPMVRVLTFRTFNVDEGTFNANLETPAIEGLGSDLESKLNKKYLEENQKLYDEFMKEMDILVNDGKGKAHLGLDSGYEVKTDNEKLLVIGRYVVNTVASSSTVIKYDTIDKQNQVLITLPSLFKNESYIEIISEDIKSQMREQMKNEDIHYWLDDKEMGDENFTLIKEDQSFYINENNQLVIAFDKYEVAPGYMGNPEFVIPTKIIQSILVSNEYIAK